MGKLHDKWLIEKIEECPTSTVRYPILPIIWFNIKIKKREEQDE